MTLKHNNPDEARLYQKKRGRTVVSEQEHWAHAPYNFIPLPKALIPANTPLDQDKYHVEDGHTGYLDITLETCSPTYIRGMMSEATFKQSGRNKAEDMSDEDKEKRSSFFSSSDREVEGKLSPVLPGSSIRGMVRNLVEIVAHSRMRWVADNPTFTYRAVAVQGEDPLKKPYQDVIGDQNNRKVVAGYLVQDGDSWFIHPAHTTDSISWGKGKEPYIKVDDEDINSKALPGYLHLNHKQYRPQLHEIRFEQGAKVKKSRPRRNSSPYRSSIKVEGANSSLMHMGMLVCSGNMAETGGRSPRKKQVIILPKDQKAKRIPIATDAIDAYIKGLSTYVADKETLKDWNKGQAGRGCLGHDKPVFYIHDNKEIHYFGHNPNFRIPALLNGSYKASTPKDFVPDLVRKHDSPDLAEAIFGWVTERDEDGPKEEARAGRIFFEDAHFVTAQHGVWYNNGQAITPKILSTPRPTTFQHYLVQDANKGHDPDNKQKIAHFGTSTSETQIRGYKHYWHRGSNPDIRFHESDGEKAEKRKTQLTQIVPLKTGVQFKGRIHFENLRTEELGAILWVLNLPHTENILYRHKLGMGKPLGMGAMAVSAELQLSDRQSRYAQLFETNSWHAPAKTNAHEFKNDFEAFILERLDESPSTFNQIDRIKQLLTMLVWRGNEPDGSQDPVWEEWTEYMQIEHEERGNEYVERPVLPTPDGVIAQLRYGKIDEQPSSLSAAKEQADNERANAAPRERTLEEGQRLNTMVVDIFDGTVILDVEHVAGLPAPEEEIDVLFRIPPEYLSGKNYRPNAQASVVVVSIVKDDENYEWIIDCKPANI